MRYRIVLPTKCKHIRNERVVTVKKFAQDNFISESTVHHWIAIKKIDAYKSGGKWWIYPRILKKKKFIYGFH